MTPEEADQKAYDHVIVGGGINALVAAVLLGKKGHRIFLL